ncbi:hypothetical protein [Marinobacter sp. VGCF2001]
MLLWKELINEAHEPGYLAPSSKDDLKLPKRDDGGVGAPVFHPIKERESV